jgi:hypothetical protein
MASTLFPLQALLVLVVVLVVAAVWRWPVLAGYLVVGLTPLTAGINRGSALPLLRPNEAIDLLVGVALVARGLYRLRSGELPRLRLGAVEVALLLLAVCSSVVPLASMAVRQQPITSDDLLYALVLWKYLGLYALIRLSVSTDQGVRRCLWISVGAASVVAVLAILQSLGLFGVPRILADYYAPYGYIDAYSARGSSTLGLPAATGDLMIFNLAIVTGFWLRYHRHRLLLAGVAALLIVATLSTGEFSSAIGLLCGIACIIAVTNSARLLKFAVPAAVLAVLVLQPVITTRLSGFQSVSGLPVSWTGRLQNLDNYFWPQLFSNFGPDCALNSRDRLCLDREWLHVAALGRRPTPAGQLHLLRCRRGKAWLAGRAAQPGRREHRGGRDLCGCAGGDRDDDLRPPPHLPRIGGCHVHPSGPGCSGAQGLLRGSCRGHPWAFRGGGLTWSERGRMA